MSLHPRRFVVQKHHATIHQAIREAIGPLDITSAELSMVLQEIALTWARYAVKDQRAFEDALSEHGVDHEAIWKQSLKED